MKLQFSRLLLTLLWSNFISTLNGKGFFYIYEWPEFMDDVWPPSGANLHPKSGYDHSFRENNGSGRMLVSEVGLYQTWQFSLYKHLIARLRMSEFRTRNPAEATAFVIPFDLGVHSYIDHLNGFPRLAAPHGRSAGEHLRDRCNGKEADIFWKYRGHDHYLIFSVTAYQMVGMQVKYFFMFVCQNCTVITIETSPTKVQFFIICNSFAYLDLFSLSKKFSHFNASFEISGD